MHEQGRLSLDAFTVALLRSTILRVAERKCVLMQIMCGMLVQTMFLSFLQGPAGVFIRAAGHVEVTSVIVCTGCHQDVQLQ